MPEWVWWLVGVGVVDCSGRERREKGGGKYINICFTA